MDKFDSKVLAIESEKLFQGGKWNGLKIDDLDRIYNILLTESEFRRRGDLETDPSFKQIIPQVVLRHNGKYFLHRQVDKSEQRLNSLCPVPLGGHVEEFDIKEGEDLIQVALHRELHEEAEVKSNIIATQFIGVIYLEDDNPVNHVHVGLAYVFDLDGEDVDIREDGLESLGFVDKQYLKENLEQLTYWSRLLIDSI